MRLGKGVVGALVAAAVAAVVVPAAASANNPGILINKTPPNAFTIDRVAPTPLHDGTTPLTQAGAHPDVNISMSFCYPTTDTGNTPYCPDVAGNPPEVLFGTSANLSTDDLGAFTLRLPPGMIANPQATPRCSLADFLRNACAVGTQVGSALVDSTGIVACSPICAEVSIPNNPGEIYNLQPQPDEVARLGAIVRPIPCPTGYFPLPSMISVRTTGDYGVDSVQDSFYHPSTLDEGLPVDLNQDRDTAGNTGPFNPCFNEPITVLRTRITLFGLVGGVPFMRNPTSCQPATTVLDVTSQGDTTEDVILAPDPNPGSGPPATDTATTTFTPTGCGAVDFTPTVDIEPTGTDKAGAPSGYRIAIDQPNSEADAIHQSHLKEAEVTLPAGVALNPAAALELDSCSEAEFGFGNTNPVACSSLSKVGDVTVNTPILDTDLSTPGVIDPLRGTAYFGPPTGPGPATDANPWKLFMVIEGSGLRIKLRGNVTLDQTSGRVKTTFKDQAATPTLDGLPQVPFTKFELKLRGGDTAILTNPRSCGTHTLSAKLTPHSGNPAVAKTATFTTSGDGQGAACPTPQPFAPTLSATPDTEQAGASVKSRIEVNRAPGQQLVKNLDVTLPPGLVGSLAAAPLCPLAQAVAGTCGEASRIGSVGTLVGDGGTSIPFFGSIYIAEPQLPGDAASLSIVVPARVGPIDLGQVVVMNRVRLDQTTAVVTTTSADIPAIFAGVPVSVRQIVVDLNREGFLRNPTSCGPKQVVANFTSDQSTTAQATFNFNVVGCQNLAFNPRLRLIAGGSKALTAKTDPVKNDVHPGLRAIVTQASGQANIAATRVVLPWVLRPSLPRLQQPGALCQEAQVATRTCPSNSRVGTATAISPLLPNPLTGPVHIVQQFEQGNPLPRLAVFLEGAVAVGLSAQNRFFGGRDPRQRIRTVNTFTGIPDVPITRFELKVDGGPNGLLNNWRDLCETPDTFDGTFNSHSGRSFSFKRGLEVEGCDEPVSILSVRTRSTRMTRSGRVRVRLRCSAAERCKGRLTLRTKSKVRISKRKPRRRRRLTLGRRSFSIPAGKTRTVRVRVRRAARRVIRRSRRGVSVRATATVTSKPTTRATLKVKRPKRKRARRTR